MSKLNFFDPDIPRTTAAAAGTTIMTNGLGLPTAPMMAIKQPPSTAVLERNRNLAMTLGVAPSTTRNEPSLTGWARPVTATTANCAGDSGEFGNELNAPRYSDSLLAEAKERMSELIKLEKQWKKFLYDDRAASCCSLKAMGKPLRKFVHTYSDFWRMHTESFDPEGRRYIQCGKMADTCAPHPMLSEAVRKWRGPTAGPTVGSVDVMMLPTGPSSRPTAAPAAAVPSTSSDGWHFEHRVPLKLVPRTAVVEITKSIPPAAAAAVASTLGMTHSSSTPLLSMTGERTPPPRFSDLHDKERPRLQLAPHSIPTWDELESRHITQDEWNEMTEDQQADLLHEIEEEDARERVQLQREKEREDARVKRFEQKAKKQRDLMVKKQAILESAFASSSDDENSSRSDWFEGDLEFDGSDDEGM